MNVKIVYHIMPWEIDYALLSFTQLKKSKYHLSPEDTVTVETVLNLSSYIINWEESKLPKEYFIEKYNTLSILLKDYNHIKHIYDGDKLYGHLNLQRDCVSKETDYYIGLCPDMYFTEYLLSYLIESAKQIPNKYFIITPQSHKQSDPSWDELTDPDYVSLPYDTCNDIDTFDVRYKLKSSPSEMVLQSASRNKFGGWFDLSSKSAYEEFAPLHDDWEGYGPYDWYTMQLADITKQYYNVDFQQYILRGQTLCEYWTGPFKEVDGFSKYHKDLLVLNNIPNQRQQFEANMRMYLNKGLEMLKQKNII